MICPLNESFIRLPFISKMRESEWLTPEPLAEQQRCQHLNAAFSSPHGRSCSRWGVHRLMWSRDSQLPAALQAAKNSKTCATAEPCTPFEKKCSTSVAFQKDNLAATAARGRCVCSLKIYLFVYDCHVANHHRRNQIVFSCVRTHTCSIYATLHTSQYYEHI